MNPEPLHQRWMRGITFRMSRDIMFGIGLNQMSDYYEERIPHRIIETQTLRTAAGSLFAGVCAGYFSHIPHNLSALKLMTPSKTYWEHMAALVGQSEIRVPDRSVVSWPSVTADASGSTHFVLRSLPARFKRPMAGVLAFVFPRAVVLRTLQVYPVML